MPCIDNRVGVSGERRQVARRPMFIAGSAVTIHGSKSVIVENLCSMGAKLRGRELPNAGKQILVWMEGLDVLGSVAWSKFDESGIVFDHPLESNAIAALEEQAVGTVFSFS